MKKNTATRTQIGIPINTAKRTDKDDEEMNTLIESVQTQGILSPLIVRPIENTDEYEVISGHRRLHAAVKAGATEVPALVVSLDRDAAAIVLVDSNLHREHILPSEKAFAYKMKLEAMKHQGWRTDLTSTQVVSKSRTDEMVGVDNGDSREQVRRYIRLTNLIPAILQYVDDGRIAFTPAVDEEEAAIVREIYERYASGETKAEIVKDLQRRRVKTSLGNEFTYNSLSRLLKNKRYIGIYLYKGVETPGGMPRILDDDLFYRVQALMNKNKSAPARTRGENEYLLTTKLFCGHCKEMMVGYGGTGKSGKQYHYYMCKKACKKKCNKKIISKDYIEDRVVSECLKMLTDEKIRYIAKKVAEECNKSPDNISAREIKKAIKEVDIAIENLWKGIEQGQAVDMLTERLHQRQVEKEELETQLAIENNKKICLSEAQILAFLDYVCEMPLDDFNKRRAIINIFVHSIYLYDDHFTLIINASKKPLSIENIPLDDIEEAFEGENTETEGCSSMMTPAPPYTA